MAPRWYVAPVARDTGLILGAGVWRRTYWAARRAQERMNNARTERPEFYALPPFRFLVIDMRAMEARRLLEGEDVDEGAEWL